jgi:hypothetical protein
VECHHRDLPSRRDSPPYEEDREPLLAGTFSEHRYRVNPVPPRGFCCHCPHETIAAQPDTQADGDALERSLEAFTEMQSTIQELEKSTGYWYGLWLRKAPRKRPWARQDGRMVEWGTGNRRRFRGDPRGSKPHPHAHRRGSNGDTDRKKPRGSITHLYEPRSGRGHAHCAMGRGAEPKRTARRDPTTYESFDRRTFSSLGRHVTPASIANAKGEIPGF